MSRQCRSPRLSVPMQQALSRCEQKEQWRVCSPNQTPARCVLLLTLLAGKLNPSTSSGAPEPEPQLAGNAARILSFWLLSSWRGKATSNLMMMLPFWPGCLLMGMPSPLQEQAGRVEVPQGQGGISR